MSVQAQVQLGICDVCLLLDGDERAKPVIYCGACNAYLCEADQGNLTRRAWAASIRAMGGNQR